MSWRNPRLNYLHAARAVGVSGISITNSWASGLGAELLIDDRAGSLATFSTSESDHTIELDRGTGSPDPVDRIYIPAGHNYGTANVRVQHSATGAWAGEESTLLNQAATAGAVFDFELAGSGSTARYLKVDWPSDSGAWATPQLILTYPETTERGPEPGWLDMLRHNTLDFEKESGAIASLSLGADRRYVEYLYRHVDVSADLTIFAALLATCGTSKPFLLDPCFDTEAAVWMKLTTDARQSLDRASPSSPDSARPEIRLSMLEHLA